MDISERKRVAVEFNKKIRIEVVYGHLSEKESCSRVQ
jgi:hypothetical protein